MPFWNWLMQLLGVSFFTNEDFRWISEIGHDVEEEIGPCIWRVSTGPLEPGVLGQVSRVETLRGRAVLDGYQLTVTGRTVYILREDDETKRIPVEYPPAGMLIRSELDEVGKVSNIRGIAVVSWHDDEKRGTRYLHLARLSRNGTFVVAAKRRGINWKNSDESASVSSWNFA